MSASTAMEAPQRLTDGKGDDIAYHPGDPVDASGWTQTLLSAFANDCTYRPPTPPPPPVHQGRADRPQRDHEPRRELAEP
ncbi:hypothetical protein WKI68_28380 [Streptomyces sp. MS1.HAVA.3]|uniref:Uncharacterized protein n=1 Tax=Streptomyces caledonius TaxID=3134107 RepID=A0ABU8U935_9ACTN